MDAGEKTQKPLRVFCCYARNDRDYLHQLKAHLRVLERQQLIVLKADLDISPGATRRKELERHLDEADIILLLISVDFIDSDDSYQREMQRAIARHQQGTACVVPVIIRPTAWQGTLLSQMQGLPRDGRPVSTWQNADEAFLHITEEIRLLVQTFFTSIGQSQEPDIPLTLSREHPSYEHIQERTNMRDNHKPDAFNFNAPIHNQNIITGGEQDQIIAEQHNYYTPQRDGLRSLEKGSKALWNGDYAAAKKELRVAIEEIDREAQPEEASRAYCFLALALLNGKLPRVQLREIMQSIESLMDNAIAIHPSASYYRIFACIKKDFFAHNGLDHRLNEAYALESRGASLPRCAADEENEQYFRRCQPRLQI